MPKSVTGHWRALDRHFKHHVKVVERFRIADRLAVRRMWKNETNEDGMPLSQLEREALVERCCELFGHCGVTCGALNQAAITPCRTRRRTFA